jgi:hypothetical protein
VPPVCLSQRVKEEKIFRRARQVLRALSCVKGTRGLVGVCWSLCNGMRKLIRFRHGWIGVWLIASVALAGGGFASTSPLLVVKPAKGKGMKGRLSFPKSSGCFETSQHSQSFPRQPGCMMVPSLTNIGQTHAPLAATTSTALLGERRPPEPNCRFDNDTVPDVEVPLHRHILCSNNLIQ